MKKIVFAISILAAALKASAQLVFTNISGNEIVTAYTGADLEVVIPATTNGYPVTGVGASSFAYTGVASVSIPDSVTFIGAGAFEGCFDLTNITVGSGLASIGDYAFDYCYSLPSINLPAGLTNLGEQAFAECSSLAGVYFAGNAPAADRTAFNDDAASVFYLPGTSGWTNYCGGAPTASWMLPYPVILNAGLDRSGSPGGFRFTVSWATNRSVIVEACTNLANPAWQPLQTNALVAGTNLFEQADWMNYPARFFRARAQ
jgi:hypothetical protein